MRMGLAGRVLSALLLVVATGVLTAWLVASAVAPGLFHRHMLQAGASAAHAEAVEHAELAFQSASRISLAVAMAAAVAASVAVSVYLTRRLARSLLPLTAAAADVASGHYAVRVGPPGLGSEFDGLADAFNHMAGELERVEDTRRRLLDDVAHEVRTPVATLGAYLEALEDGVRVLDADTLDVMQAQVVRLARLARDVSAVSRAEEGYRTLDAVPVHPGELLDAAVAVAVDRYRAKGVALSAQAADGLPGVVVDVDRMGQVLGNLLDNALRYTPDGGQVRVAARRHGHLVRITVTDDGEGIGAEHLPHLFERFYRVDTARDRGHGGSGIGLAIVKALVEAHGGTVAADSDGPGQGTTFTVDLPAAASPSR
jgi:two-component system, OmpR family, sensor histidine kinase BaeS